MIHNLRDQVRRGVKELLRQGGRLLAGNIQLKRETKQAKLLTARFRFPEGNEKLQRGCLPV